MTDKARATETRLASPIGDLALSVLIGPIRFVAPLVSYLILYPLIIREYGLETLGLWAFFGSLQAVFSAADMGFSLTLMRSVGPDLPLHQTLTLKRDAIIVKRLYLALGLVGAALCALSIPIAEAAWSTSPYSQTGLMLSLAVFTFGIAIDLIAKTEMAVLTAHHDSKSTQFIAALAPVVAFAPSLTGVLIGLPLEGLASGILAGALASLYFSRQRLRSRHRTWTSVRAAVPWHGNVLRLRQMIREALSFYMVSLGMLFREPTFRVTLLILLGLESIGLYDIALRLTRFARDIIAIGFSPLLAAFSRLLRDSAYQEIVNLIRASIQVLVCAGIATLGLILIASDVIFGLWLGEFPDELVRATQILAIWHMVTLLNVPFWYILQAAHYEKEAAIALWLHTISTFLLLPISMLFDVSLSSALAYWLCTALATQGLIFFFVQNRLRILGTVLAPWIMKVTIGGAVAFIAIALSALSTFDEITLWGLSAGQLGTLSLWLFVVASMSFAALRSLRFLQTRRVPEGVDQR